MRKSISLLMFAGLVAAGAFAASGDHEALARARQLQMMKDAQASEIQVSERQAKSVREMLQL